MTGQRPVNDELVIRKMSMPEIMRKVSSMAENQIIQVLFPLAYSDSRIEGDADG